MYQEGRILISGMQGLGAEIAKILVIRKCEVVLHDEKDVDILDLSGCFLFSQCDVGSNRAAVSARKLEMVFNLNPVPYLSGKLTKEQLAGFEIVIFTDIELEEALLLSDYCHFSKPPIKFIRAQVSGVCGCLFTDFGAGSYLDKNCQQLQDGGKEYKPLREGMEDFESFEGPTDSVKALYLAFKTLDIYKAQNHGLPNPKFGEDTKKFMQLAWKVNQTWGEKGFKEMNKEMLLRFASSASAVIAPIAAFIGSIVAQEVWSYEIPSSILQFFLFELVPPDVLDCLNLGCLNVQPSKRSYSAQISVFGSEIQDILMETRVVLMGCGNVGCEILKNLALMGIGEIVIFYDDVCDSVENMFYNSSDEAVEHAAACAKKINPSVRVSVVKGMDFLGFIDHHWPDSDVVISTVDKGKMLDCNLKALYWGKPFITAGSGSSTFAGSVFVPNITSIPFPYSVHNLIACRQLFLEATNSRQDEVDVLFNKFYYEEERIDSLELYSIDDCFLWACQKYRDIFPIEEQLTRTSPTVQKDHLLLLLYLTRIRAHERGIKIPSWARDEEIYFKEGNVSLPSIYEVDSSHPSSTSSSAIASLSCIELVKIMSGLCRVEDYRTIEGDICTYAFRIEPPLPVFEERHQDISWKEWDIKWIDEETGLGSLVQRLNGLRLRLKYILCGTKLIYSIMVHDHEERLRMTLGEIVRKFVPDMISESYAGFVVCCHNDQYKVLCLPTILIELSH